MLSRATVALCIVVVTSRANISGLSLGFEPHCGTSFCVLIDESGALQRDQALRWQVPNFRKAVRVDLSR